MLVREAKKARRRDLAFCSSVTPSTNPSTFMLFGKMIDPNVEQHDRAEPSADADSRVGWLQRERGDEMLAEQSRAEDPRSERGPAEVLERARRDEFRDALRAAVIGRVSLRERLPLDKIEIVEQADPHDAEEKV